MKYGLPFIALGFLCALHSVSAPPLAVVLLVNLALCFGAVGAAYLGAGPAVFMKQRSGAFSPPGCALFWPYLLMNHLLLRLMRFSKERVLDRIVPGLYLGRRLTGNDVGLLPEPRLEAVLDLTCEFPELRELRRPDRYRCIPLLDTRTPTGDQLALGVAFIREQIARGPVFVHCALGHGRSALFVAAYLLAAGHARTPDAALERIREKRPGIELNTSQREALERFAATLARNQESVHES